MINTPLAYFISFRTYGTWLHGDERGSVDRRHSEFGDPLLPASAPRVAWEQSKQAAATVLLDDDQRRVVDTAIRGVCEHKGWKLHELNVRTNHVHCVVTAETAPEAVMNAFKSWATRRLREEKLVASETKVWSRHGSTVYIFRPEKLQEKRRYVRECQ